MEYTVYIDTPDSDAGVVFHARRFGSPEVARLIVADGLVERNSAIEGRHRTATVPPRSETASV